METNNNLKKVDGEETRSKAPGVTWVLSFVSKSNNPLETFRQIDVDNKKAKVDGVLGLCYCPGKNISSGRDNKTHRNNLENDQKHFKENLCVNTIVCLLNKYEQKTLGVDKDNYIKLCSKLEIQLLFYEIDEMSTPKDPVESIDEVLLENLVQKLIEFNGKIIIHCRGGVGRAGTIAALILIKLGFFDRTKEVLKYLRAIRNPRCVESKKQEDYIINYNKNRKKLIEIK